ncbi:MAG TPA: hypothetical protein VG099_06010 [Gemmataceae bacterium]|nr:hypothetical protein [Gemmataceae bacterium]
MMSRRCRHCGVELPAVAEASCFACHRALDEPVADNARSAPGAEAGAPWLAWVWIAGGIYFLVRTGWPPRVPIFAIGGCFAIAIGAGLWFVERYELFRPWRLAIRYLLLGVALAALAAAVAWH